jgi:hypothetical protein
MLIAKNYNSKQKWNTEKCRQAVLLEMFKMYAVSDQTA